MLNSTQLTGNKNDRSFTDRFTIKGSLGFGNAEAYRNPETGRVDSQTYPSGGISVEYALIDTDIFQFNIGAGLKYGGTGGDRFTLDRTEFAYQKWVVFDEIPGYDVYEPVDISAMFRIGDIKIGPRLGLSWVTDDNSIYTKESYSEWNCRWRTDTDGYEYNDCGWDLIRTTTLGVVEGVRRSDFALNPGFEIQYSFEKGNDWGFGAFMQGNYRMGNSLSRGPNFQFGAFFAKFNRR